MFKAKRILVKVCRDVMSASSKVIFAHEFSILEALYGKGNVSIVDMEKAEVSQFAVKGSLMKGKAPVVEDKNGVSVAKVDTGELELDEDEEFSRLGRVYGMHPDINIPMVEYIYSRPAALKNEENWALPDEEETANDGVDINKNSYSTVNEIKMALEHLGIEYSAKFNKQALSDLLRGGLIELLTIEEIDHDEEASAHDLMVLAQSHELV